MPIVDVLLVAADAPSGQQDLARSLADTLGQALQVPAGGLWVRLHALPASHYAENDSVLSPDELPVFVSVLHARPPGGQALDAEIAKVTEAVARATNRATDRVHLEYAPAGAGRIAFGGRRVA